MLERRKRQEMGGSCGRRFLMVFCLVAWKAAIFVTRRGHLSTPGPGLREPHQKFTYDISYLFLPFNI